jgi:hypothetical protein
MSKITRQISRWRAKKFAARPRFQLFLTRCDLVLMLPHDLGMRRKTDLRPGSVPMIRAAEGSLTYTIVPALARRDEELVIRCDDEGEVWISIQPARAGSR